MVYGIIKELASGQIHATASVVYNAPAGKYVEVASVWLHNSSGAALSALVAFPTTDVTGSRRLNESIGGNETYEVSPKIPWVLFDTGSITMLSSNSSSVNYIIYGREQV